MLLGDLERQSSVAAPDVGHDAPGRELVRLLVAVLEQLGQHDAGHQVQPEHRAPMADAGERAAQPGALARAGEAVGHGQQVRGRGLQRQQLREVLRHAGP